MTTHTTTTAFWHPFADMASVSRDELLIERGEGVYVYDAEDRRYLDATASLWYANLGHGRAEIADAVSAQMRKLEAYSTFGEFSNQPANALCRALAERAPMEDARVFLGSGGGKTPPAPITGSQKNAATLSGPTRRISSSSAVSESNGTLEVCGTSGPQLVTLASIPPSEVPKPCVP